MPPAAKKDCGVVLFDVNSIKKDMLVEAFIKVATFEYLDSRNIYRLVLANSKKTDNELNYPNIYTTEIDDLNPKSVLECVELEEGAEGDWLDALLLAIHHLKDASSAISGIVNLQLLFFTTLDRNNRQPDQKKVDKIINDLNYYGIFLYIVGPNVKFTSTILTPGDVPKCMKTLKIDESNPSLVAARKIVQATQNSVLCDTKVGVNLFYCFKNPRGTQPWKVPLSFGSILDIQSCTLKVFGIERPLSITAKYDSQRSKQELVLADDESVTVDFKDLINGVIRHGKFVKIDNAMFKVEGERSFNVLGFTDQKFVPEYLIQGDDTFHVIPCHERGDEQCDAFYHLVNVLAEEKKYGIVRRVYNRGNVPRFYLLVPRPDLTPPCFLMTELPYSDELLGNHKFEIPKKTKARHNDRNFNKFFDSLDIHSERSLVEVPLGPSMMFDWFTSKLINFVANKYLNRNYSFDGMNQDVVYKADFTRMI